LEYHNSPLVFLLYAEEIAFEFGHFLIFQTSVALTLTLDRVSLIGLYVHQI